MKKILIKIPKTEKDKWMLGLGARPRSMARCDTLLNRLERELSLWLKVNGKTSIRVKSYNDSHWEKDNETLNAESPSYLIYTASCFLEDYLSDKTKNRIEKKYLSKS